MSDWNHDISKAPRGQMVPQEQQRRGADGKVSHAIVNQFVPDWLWLATKCGKVLKSHWLPADGKFRPVGRWGGFNANDEPVAWQPFVVPVHPGLPAESEAA